MVPGCRIFACGHFFGRSDGHDAARHAGIATVALLEDIVRPGALLFDAGRFFEAHEAWEAHWLVEKDESRRLLLQGLIQIAAALHKLIDKRAPEPAASLFKKGLAKLDACPAQMGELDVASFRERVRACAVDASKGLFDRAALPVLDARPRNVLKEG